MTSLLRPNYQKAKPSVFSSAINQFNRGNQGALTSGATGVPMKDAQSMIQIPQAGGDGSLLSLFNDFFGKPAKPYKLAYEDHDVQHETLMEAYDGDCKQLTEMMILQITENELWLLNSFAPIENYDGKMKILMDKMIFNDHRLDPLAEEGIARLTTHRKEISRDFLHRSGLGFLVNSVYLNTPNGQQVFVRQLQQIRNAALETLCMGIIWHYFNHVPYEDDNEKYRTNQANPEVIDGLIRDELDRWACLCKEEHAAQMLIEDLDRAMMNRGETVADCMIWPFGSFKYGSDGPFAVTGQKYDAHKNYITSQIDRKMTHKESRMFRLGNHAASEDPHFRRRTIGGFNRPMCNVDLDSVPMDQYVTSMLDIIVYNEKSDNWSRLKYKDYAEYAGLYERDSDNLSPIGEEYFDKYQSSTWGEHYQAVNEFDRMVDKLHRDLNKQPSLWKKFCKIFDVQETEGASSSSTKPTIHFSTPASSNGPAPKNTTSELDPNQNKFVVPWAKLLPSTNANLLLPNAWKTISGSVTYSPEGTLAVVLQSKKSPFRYMVNVEVSDQWKDRSDKLLKDQFPTPAGEILWIAPADFWIGVNMIGDTTSQSLSTLDPAVIVQKAFPFFKTASITVQLSYLSVILGNIRDLDLPNIVQSLCPADGGTNYTPIATMNSSLATFWKIHPSQDHAGKYLLLRTKICFFGLLLYVLDQVSNKKFNPSQSQAAEDGIFNNNYSLDGNFYTSVRTEFQTLTTEAGINNLATQDFAVVRIAKAYSGHISDVNISEAEVTALMASNFTKEANTVEKLHDLYKELVKYGVENALLPEDSEEHELKADAFITHGSEYINLLQMFNFRQELINNKKSSKNAAKIMEGITTRNFLLHCILASALLYRSMNYANLGDPYFIRHRSHCLLVILESLMRGTVISFEDPEDKTKEVIQADEKTAAGIFKIMLGPINDAEHSPPSLNIYKQIISNKLISMPQFAKDFIDLETEFMDLQKDNKSSDGKGADVYISRERLVRLLCFDRDRFGVGSRKFWQFQIDNNGYQAIGLFLMRPNQSYTMGSAIYAHGGGNSGITALGHQKFRLGSDAPRDLIYGQYTLYHKTLILHKKRVIVVHDILPAGYNGGNGISAWHPLDFDNDFDDYQAGVMTHSYFVAAVPINWTPGDLWYMDLTGEHDKSIQTTGNTRNGELHYPSADIYTKWWGWSAAQLTVLNRSYFAEEYNSPLYNTMLFQNMTFYYVHETSSKHGSFSGTFLERGHWGDRVYASSGRVRRGKALRFERPDYLGTKTVTLGN